MKKTSSEVYIFDVDGTLTPSRGIIDSEFKLFFNQFCKDNTVILVTGSDRNKTIEQIGKDTYDLCHTVYNCNGNDVWRQDTNVYSLNWQLGSIEHEWLNKQLENSLFPIRTGAHFEYRPGMVNFSIIGRNANKEERSQYIEWDTSTNERVQIATMFNSLFKTLTATVGGETGLDIALKGADKSQIIKNIVGTTHFFGDKMHPGGNDHTLSLKVDHKYPVTCWQDTFLYFQKTCLNTNFKTYK